MDAYQSNNIMQKIHLVGLILTGACVVILCIGIGIGIIQGKSDSEEVANLNNTSPEYVQYDEDYVDGDLPQIADANVIEGIRGSQGNREHVFVNDMKLKLPLNKRKFK